jgi:hypothetical protein
MKTSRDLMLLASVAFKNGKFEDAASLFAASLSSDDSEAFMQALNTMDDPKAEPLEIESVSSGAPSLSEIVASIANALSDHQIATAAEEDEDDEESNDANEEEVGDDDTDEDEDDEESEDEDGDDESVSTASAAKTSGVKRLPKGEQNLVQKVNSPIKLKS